MPHVSGTTRLKLTQQGMAKVQVALPPLPEQRRIVAKLDRLFERTASARDELAHIPTLVEHYKQAILRKAFIELDDAVETPLGDLLSFGPQNGLYLPKSEYGEGTPILRIENYGFEGAEPIEAWSKVRIDPATASKYALEAGDIVINRVNSPSHLGKSLLVLDAHRPAVFESNMMRMQLSDRAHPEYVQLFLSSDFGRKRLTANAKWAVNQASINQGDVCRTEIPIPSIKMQARIVEDVHTAMNWVKKIANEYAHAEKLLLHLDQSLLRKAFRGELVHQNPDDEPADRLLERVRAERQAQPKARRGRRAKERV
jgi:type I restriction enzyme S subunit